MRAIPQMISPRTMPKIPAITSTAATIHRSVYMTVLYPFKASGMQAPFATHSASRSGYVSGARTRTPQTESRPPWETSSTSS